ncbi:MAG: hypothetical protein IT435_05930 [Phycisphaerales bacterium]|nr:hypothetical protein [Phycisphaerales bacterium]
MNVRKRLFSRPGVLAFLFAVLVGVAGWPMAYAGDAPAAAPQSAPISIPAARQATNIAIITINGHISDVTAKSVARRLKLAERAGADAVVFEIHSTSGALGAALDICNTIKQSAISNTVAWINTTASSTGATIALACREIITSDPATLGDALPVGLDRLGNIVPMRDRDRERATASLLAEVVDSARRRGHDEYLVQGLVALGVELWLVENHQTGQRLCINRAEYQELFGTPPAPLRPRLISAPPPVPLKSRAGSQSQAGPTPSGTTGTPPSPDTSTNPASSPSTDQTTPSAAPSADPAQAPANPDGTPTTVEQPNAEQTPPPSSGTPDPIDFKPAAPRLSGMSKEVSLIQDRSSQRPIIAADQRGQWKLVEYISDGNGPYTLRADDLLHFGLSAGIVRGDDQLVKFFGAGHQRRLDQNWSETLVVVLTTQWARGLLIAIFLIAMVMEMLHPGVVLPGTVAAVALILLITPPLLIGMANWWEIAAIGVGIGLLGVEVLILPGFGVPGVLGLLLLFVGLIGTFVGQGGGLFPNSPETRSELMGGLVTVLTAFVSAGFGIYFITRNLQSIPLLNQMVLKPVGMEDDEAPTMFEAIPMPAPGLAIGDTGVSITPLRTAGKAQFGDRVIDVSSSLGYIDAGTRLRIVSSDAFHTVVEPIPHASAKPGQNA